MYFSPYLFIADGHQENYFRRADEDQHPQRDEGDEKINMVSIGHRYSYTHVASPVNFFA